METSKGIAIEYAGTALLTALETEVPVEMAELSLWLRIKYSFYSTLVFVLVTNPMMMKLLQDLFGGILQGGILTPVGWAAQVLLFFAAILAIMMLPRDA